MVSFLKNPNENSDSSNRLSVLSATDYIFYALDCVSNVRCRAQTQDACNIIIVKAPGLYNYLKGRIPRSTSVAGMTPNDVFIAFGNWINNT